jgi:hypothetical protein
LHEFNCHGSRLGDVAGVPQIRMLVVVRVLMFGTIAAGSLTSTFLGG